jgi:hypothetical protein
MAGGESKLGDEKQLCLPQHEHVVELQLVNGRRQITSRLAMC